MKLGTTTLEELKALEAARVSVVGHANFVRALVQNYPTIAAALEKQDAEIARLRATHYEECAAICEKISYGIQMQGESLLGCTSYIADGCARDIRAALAKEPA